MWSRPDFRKVRKKSFLEIFLSFCHWRGLVKTNILKHSALEDALRPEKAPASFLSGSLLLLSATATIFSSDHFLPPAPPGPALVRLVRGGAGPAQDNAPPVPHHQPNTSDFCAWLFHPKFYRGGKSPKLQELSPPVADPSVVVAPMADPGSQPSLLATFCPSDHHRRLTTTPTRRPWSFSALERDMSPASAPHRLKK